ncbi:phage tail protein [Clostridium neonatale]|uniref:Phage tail fiber protein n=3 Tax=Clostridium neonatale TaxID=137838 RepID=A0AA86JJD2_9CLOT|nr:phage tail protein [Clostridium neonatale]MBP8312263.1 phage tail protein [Clostridium neonatale]CAG9705811.1 Putative phage tail fiber protein [Clostridium neonatale]
MAEKFYTIITDIGKAKIANCISQATKVDFVKMKVGDGGGKYYNPIETQTDLINTVWEGDIGHVVVDKENPNWINIEVILPADVGGFMIREYGVFDSENNLLAIAKCAETYKPVAAEGSTKELNMKMILAISNIDSITLKIDPALMYAKKKDLDVISNKVNDIEDKLNKHIDDSLYQEAGGTATAITLSMLTLKNGYSKTFIATANNNGSATTINGKPLYKPGTTTGPNIKEGKAYTVWYNSVSDCFFLQASAEGDATVAQVLAGAIFSTDDDTGLVGAMSNNTGTNKELSLNETWVIPKGYHDGNGRVTQNIPNNGAINANLNCGQSKDIPAGYTNGGRITANSLASQTPANADASTIIAGRNAWVNGNLITGNAMKAKSIVTIETITRNGIGWTAGGTVEITFNTPFDILLVGSYIIVNNGQLQMNYLPVFSDNRIVLSISNDRRTLYMRNTNTSCGWNSTIFLFSINYKE